jgi:multiple sugar transport system substrate-binding protein
MDAYNVKLVDDSGKLLVDDPKVKEGLIGALRDYTDIYTRGCTPPSSIELEGLRTTTSPSTTRRRSSRTTRRFSIVAKWVDDANNPTLTQEQRDQAKKNVAENIATAGFPNKPDGKPMVYRTA